MNHFERIDTLKDFLAAQRKPAKRISFVPTMGALHQGHKSCIEIARGAGGILVESIFVNPTQFGPAEDLDAYPRRTEEDKELLESWGCDVLFAPSAEEMYEARQTIWIDVEHLTGVLCGKRRPGHFRGVATVVSKLFNIVEPDVAVFGQKDAQQAVVIREMVKQLNFPVDIRLSPIVREPDGLAVSSRNEYLSREERKIAPGLYKALCLGRALLEKGERTADAITRAVHRELQNSGIEAVEYVELVGSENLAPVDLVSGRVLLAVAARIGSTRLIDNMVLDVGAKVRETLLF